MKNNALPTALICSQSDFSSDYRIHKMSTTLQQAGFGVEYLGRSHSRHAPNHNADTHIMRLLFERSALFYLELNVRLFFHLLRRRRKPSLIVAIDLDTLGGCYLASRLRGIPLLFDSHEYFPESPEIAHKPFVKWVWRTIERAIVPRLTLCVTVCQSIADIFRQKYGVHFHVVRNMPLASRRLTIERSTEPRKFTILYQGAVNIGRGIEQTLMALPQLPDCHFTVVGDGDISQKVRRMAADLGVADRVTFVGKVPYDELRHYMGSSDVGVCLFENLSLNYYLALPNRLFDFVQAQLPMLAVRFPEIERIIEGYNIGRCIDSLTPEAIVREVEYIRQNPDVVEQWRANMLKATPELAWEHDAQKILPSLEAIANEAKKRKA